jgi:hypothetical protein
MKNKLIFIFLLLLGLKGFAHDYYVSIADFEFNEKKQRIEGTIKMTAHDFEYVLEKKFNQKILLDELEDSSEVSNYIAYYLAKNFKIYSGGKPLVQNYIGLEVTLEQDAYVYLTFENVSRPKSIEIKSFLLYEYFPSQQNIVHYKFGKQTKSLTLVASRPQGGIKID